MFVWRKGNINKNCLCVTVLCKVESVVMLMVACCMVVESTRHAVDLVAARLSTEDVTEDARLVSCPTGAYADESRSLISHSCSWQ